MKKGRFILGLVIALAVTQPVFASTLTDLKPSGTGDPTQQNKYQSSGEGTPNMEDINREASSSKETVEDSHWDITERDTTFRTDLNKGITRFEVFYSASGKVPYIAFQTPEGDIYESGKDSENIVSRDENQINGHSDLRYEVIYLISPSSTDNLKVKVSLDSVTHDFMMIKSAVPQGWNNFRQEYRTEPEKLLLWGFHNSENNITDLIAIAENTDVKPVENGMESAPPPVVEKADPTGLIIWLLIFAAIGVGVMIFLNNMTKKHQEQDALNKRVKKKNLISKKNKIANAKSLDSVLDEFNDDYSDDDFFSNAKAVEEDKVSLPIEKKIAFKEEDEEEEIRPVKKPVKEEIQKKDDKAEVKADKEPAQVTVPAEDIKAEHEPPKPVVKNMTQAPEVKKPSWI